MKPRYSYTKKEGVQFENAGQPLVDFFRSAAAQRQSILDKEDNLYKLFGEAYTLSPLPTRTLLETDLVRSPRGIAEVIRKLNDFGLGIILMAVHGTIS